MREVCLPMAYLQLVLVFLVLVAGLPRLSYLLSSRLSSHPSSRPSWHPSRLSLPSHQTDRQIPSSRLCHLSCHPSSRPSSHPSFRHPFSLLSFRLSRRLASYPYHPPFRRRQRQPWYLFGNPL